MTKPKSHEGAEPKHRRCTCCQDNMGHAFGERLICKCRKTWWGHQARPTPCPLAPVDK